MKRQKVIYEGTVSQSTGSLLQGGELGIPSKNQPQYFNILAKRKELVHESSPQICRRNLFDKLNLYAQGN